MAKLKRRGNNEGSIFEVAGGWRGMVSQRLGKRKVFSGKTKIEVAGKVRTFLENESKGIVTAPALLTVAKHMATWLRETVEPNGSSNTYDYYEYPTRCHIIPAIGSIKLGNLRPDDIRKMLNDRRGTLSPRTVLAIHATLKAALSVAVQDGILEKNVAKLVKTTDAKRVQEERVNNFAVLTGEQSADLLHAIQSHAFKCFVVVAMMTGIRRGEICGLTWDDIDFDGGWMKIRRSIVRVKVKRLKVQPETRFSGAGSKVAPLKNPKMKRDIQLSGLVREALLEQRSRQQAERLLAGDRWVEQDFIFTSRLGSHWHPDTTTKIFQEIRVGAGLPDGVSLHDMRHSFASAQMTVGTHPKLVQTQLGHSRMQTTMDIYSHMQPGQRTTLPDTMEAFIAKGKESRALREKMERTSGGGLALVKRKA